MVPRLESLYAFLSSIKIASGRNAMELDVDETKGNMPRDLLGCKEIGKSIREKYLDLAAQITQGEGKGVMGLNATQIITIVHVFKQLSKPQNIIE